MSFSLPDHTGAAAIYAVSNTFSWAQQLLIPGIQAAANMLILEKQKDLYEDISNEQKSTVNAAVTNYFACVEALLPSFKDAYPDVPEAAEYTPVNPCCEQTNTIECNIAHLDRTSEWAATVGRLHIQHDLARMVALDPRWVANMDLYSQSVQDLLRGRLPVSDVMEVMTDTAEQAALTGRIGGARHLTARNLGISRLRMQAAGRDAMGREATIHGQVSPTNRQVDIREMMQTPQQRIALALTQAQLIQNSLQNVLNRNAQKPPHRLAELNMRLERCINKLQHEASKASLVNTFVPNYAAVLQPMIQAIGGSSPAVTKSSYNSPSVGGNYQQLMNADPYGGYGGGSKSGL